MTTDPLRDVLAAALRITTDEDGKVASPDGAIEEADAIIAALAAQGVTLTREPDPLECCQFACYEDPGCTCDGCVTREPGLREAVAFVADWAHDCSPSNRATPWERQTRDEIDPRAYGFDDIEDRCRAALAQQGVPLTREPGLREALEIIERLKRALTVAHHRPHDNLGPVDPDSGFPTCSGCEAILTEPDAALASEDRP